MASLLAACAGTPSDDVPAPAAPQDVAAPTSASSAPTAPTAPPAAAAAAAATSDASLTPAERQARARQAATQADEQAQQALQAQCTELRSEIREQQLNEQQAPNTSVSEEIVQAKEAHADQRIQQLQDQYESLDCARVVGPQSRTPVAPVAPAPNGLGPPGAQGGPGVP